MVQDPTTLPAEEHQKLLEEEIARNAGRLPDPSRTIELTECGKARTQLVLLWWPSLYGTSVGQLIVHRNYSIIINGMTVNQ